MTKKEKIALLIDELEDIRCNNFDAGTDEDKTLREAVHTIQTLEQVLNKVIERSLCDSCTNRGCIFQSGIVRKHCDFYKVESEGV